MFGAEQFAIDQIELVPSDKYSILVQVEAYMAFGVAWCMDYGNASTKRKNIPVFNSLRDGNALICLCFDYQFLHLITKAFRHGVECGFEILGVESAELLRSFDKGLLSFMAYNISSFTGKGNKTRQTADMVEILVG